MNNKKGFTLIELLVVVLIIGILAAMAMPAYFRSVERARISEAEILMGTVVQAQQRYKLRRGSGYATNWKALDTAPAGVADGSALLGTSTSKYCTKGGGASATSCGNGFQVELVGNSSAAGNNSGVIATRTGNDQYGQYQLARYYDPHTITGYGDVICAAGSNTNAQALCLDFMTVDTYPSTEPTLPSAAATTTPATPAGT